MSTAPGAKHPALDPSKAKRVNHGSFTGWKRLDRLPLRLLAFVLIPLISITVATGVWVIGSLEEQLEHRLQREVEMVARALRLPIEQALHRNGPQAVIPALDSVFSIRRVYGAYVYDGNGELVASSAGVEPASDKVGVGEVLTAGRRSGRYDEIDGLEVYSYFVPLSGPGEEMIGVLRVTRKKADLLHYISGLRGVGLALLGLTSLALIVIVLLGYHVSVGRPLQRFAQSIHRVAAGELGHRALVSGPAEVGSLARQFNSMLDALSRSENELRREYSMRQAAERDLRHAERLAMIGRVVAGVAHELGTPLSTVSGHAQRLLRRRTMEPTVREALRAIRRQTARMEGLVRQLLDYGGKSRPNPAQVDARSLLAVAADALAPIVADRNIQLQLSDVEQLSVIVDRMRLEQALINLMRNAVQAATHKVQASFTVDDEGVSFIVDDDGVGVEPGIRARLYEPFVTSRQSSGGTGLGLAICSTVASEHGGSLSDTQSPLGGARFVLTIPQRTDLEGATRR